MTRTTRWIIVVALAVIAVWLFYAIVPGDASATSKAQVAAHVTQHDRIIERRGPFGCPDDSTGRSGWVSVEKEVTPWPRQDKWRLEWSGSFCYGHGKIQDVTWNKPTGWTAALYQWNYHPQDLQVIASNVTGPYRYKQYRGHFSFNVAGLHLDRYPIMLVKLWGNGDIEQSGNCGCN
jgi:hypothetical protein